MGDHVENWIVVEKEGIGLPTLELASSRDRD